MKITIHQTHHTIADFEGIFQTLKEILSNPATKDELHLFPELFLTGYPLQDLCLQKSFIKRYQLFLREINELSLSLEKDKKSLLIGGLCYQLTEETLPTHIYNVIYELKPGEELRQLYQKILLPNYDIFDERKYFTPGEDVCVYEFAHKKIALQICEDMWPSNYHKKNPTALLKELNTELDLVINLSASPFDIQKNDSRLRRAKEISHTLKAPFVYVNRVGVEDEIIFDGGSFALDGEEVMLQAKFFQQDRMSFSFPSKGEYKQTQKRIVNTWENLFSPHLDTHNHLKKLNDKNCQDILNALCFGLQEYVQKNHFKKLTVALSGGVDSALVLTIAKLSLQEGQSLEAIYMPSEYSSSLSQELSEELCQRLEIPLSVFPIKSIHHLLREQFQSVFTQELSGLSDENIQSRLRGNILYARSNQIGSMVINTSNKSELAVGYSTLYGDSVGAISLLGDLYKSEVYDLCAFINKKYDTLIPEKIITRAPSAELRDDQKDSDSLPSYDILDAILEGILSYRMDANDLIAAGFKKEDVHKVINLYKRSEYKRKQFPLILKVKSKSFGFGYRNPISKKSHFYLE